jgi:septum site-determining protein MinC
VSEHEATSRVRRGVGTVRPYQIRGRFLTAIALRLEGPADHAMLAELDAQLHHTPRFFADAPMVIDLEQAAGQVTKRDLTALIEHLRFRRVSVFAIQGGTREQQAVAASLGLVSLPVRPEASPKGKDPEEAPALPVAEEPARLASLLVTVPVRSGQTVAAEAGDLVIVGSVSSGAELIAAGNIHVYGRLRGRAFAGAFGDANARIFCHSLDAELVSIAGLYGTSETLDRAAWAQAVQIFLQGERLCVEPLGQPQNRDRSGQ